ncbi:hypothetical protein C2L80_11885, partial [Rubneribacter badeniensis]
MGVRSSVETAVRQQTKLAPAAIRGLEILALPTADLIGYICGEAEENPLLDVDFHHELFSCDPLPSCFEGKALEGSFGGCRRHGVEARAFDYSRIADACRGCGRFSGRPRRPAPAASCGRLSYRTPCALPRRTPSASPPGT